nr:immunoglobulin light chain junction region [Macaca mulatta]MOV94240.1 immunoglobulin light chain junction region [Macaca mulatta]MOV94655.1 immunoglobulin light chain junction region [Macaca mulatta]MOV94672.1 immunoglobulin light chain junction region [Macaca mulatta]MOV94681.1 immunoglobulin light chain junction region [Macaca mulatta]
DYYCATWDNSLSSVLF